MRKIVVALVVALLALALAGCGGGKEEAAPAEEKPAEEAPAAPAAAPVEPDRSANDSDLLPAAFPSFTSTDTPAIFQERLDAKRPMVIFFYDDAQQVTGTVRAELDAVMNEYRGLADYIVFSVGGDQNDPNVLAAVTYASELGVPSTPYIIMVDRNGFITWRSKGYAEKTILMREVERASK